MKRIARWAGIILALLLLAVFSLPFLIDANQFRPMLETELTKALAREVKVGDLKLAALSGGVTADDLSVADDPAYSKSPFLHTKSLMVGVDLWPLITSRKLHVTRIVIDQPQIGLVQSPAGDWNFSSLGGKSKTKAPPTASTGSAADLSVNLVQITNGRLSMSQLNSHAKAKMLENVNIELRDFSSTAAFPLTLTAKLAGGGDIKLDGTVGPFDAEDAAQTPAKVSVKLARFDLGAAGVESSGGLAGLLSLDGTGSTNGKSLSLSGRIKAERLKLAKNGSPANEPVEFDFVLEHNLRQRSGVLRRGDIHIGKAPASLTGTYAQHGESTVINMNLSGPDMPVPQLAALLPAMGIVLPSGASFRGGTATARLNFAGPAELLVTSGSLGLSNTSLTGFDLGSKMSTVEKLAGIKTGPNTEIQTFSANVRMAPEGSSAQDVKLVVPTIGELSGNGTVSPSQALDFKMVATLHGGVIGVLSSNGIPFLIGGTASNPVFRPDMRAYASEQVKSLEKGDLGKVAGGLLNGVFGKKKK